ncbi:trypsin domain-containing protein [Phthorimaea operculella]|nr:trypsin domain-containing protein [Phthorimaea operculella]
MNCTVHSEAKTDFSTGTDGLLLTRKPVQDLGRKETETLRQKVARKWVDGNQVVFRVVNGRQATLGQFPYQVSFRRRVGKTNVFMNFCGGAVITPSEVLSAAHCFRHGETVADQLGAWCGRNSDRAKDEVVKRVFAVAGTVFSASRYHEPNETTGADAHKHGQWRRVRAVRFPSSYHFPQDDIAVVFLIGSYEWTDTVKPIPYAETYKDYKGSCLVSGYGRIKGGHRSPALLYAALRMMRPSKCSLVHERDMSRMICSADTVADTAKGDSGTLFVTASARWCTRGTCRA